VSLRNVEKMKEKDKTLFFESTVGIVVVEGEERRGLQ
jgi:hypothetical protein